MKTFPFTYILYHKHTQLWYYGVRYAEGCHPNDLFTIYFSSSKYVKALIKEYGVNSFKYCVDRIFRNKLDAIRFEKIMLKSHFDTNRNIFLNRSLGNNSFGLGNTDFILIHNAITGEEVFQDRSSVIPIGYDKGASKTHKLNLSLSTKGRKPWNKDKKYITSPCSESRKNNIRNARLKTDTILCGYCNKNFDPGNFKQFHGEKCRNNPKIDLTILEKRSELARNNMCLQKSSGAFSKPKTPIGLFKCPHCSKIGKNYGNMHKNHFNRCKQLEALCNK